jgi:hypothetical protein
MKVINLPYVKFHGNYKSFTLALVISDKVDTQ